MTRTGRVLPRANAADVENPRMSSMTHFRDPWISPRIRISALWASVPFVFVYVDPFGLHRADVRGDIECGRIAGTSIGRASLLGVTADVALTRLMVFPSLILPVRDQRIADTVLAAVYALTIAGGAFGEWNPYFVLGSAVEVASPAGIVRDAWAWPKPTDDAATQDHGFGTATWPAAGVAPTGGARDR